MKMAYAALDLIEPAALKAFGVHALLVEWLFGVHTCASLSCSSQSVTEQGGELLFQRRYPCPHQRLYCKRGLIGKYRGFALA